MKALDANSASDKRKSQAKTGQSFWEERFKLSAFLYAVPIQANTISYSLGGLTFITFLILLASGAWLAQYFNPSFEMAHQSIDYIMREAYLGWFIRGIHHWSAQLAYALLLLHLTRVLFFAAYKRPREFTYYFGLALFLLMTVMVLTGTILKWDQEGFEALEHFSAIGTFLGSPQGFFSERFTDSTDLLSRVFTLHISILPLLIVAVLAGHVFLIKTLKISPEPWSPEAQQDHGEAGATFGGHLRLLTKLGLGFLATVSVLSLLFSPPFGPEAVAGESGVRPWWVFLWLYFLENQVGDVSGAVYGAAGLGLFLVAVPLLDRRAERHPLKRPIVIQLIIVYLLVIAMSFAGYYGEAAIHFAE